MNDEAITLRRRIDDEMSETLREYRGRIADDIERLGRIDEALTLLSARFVAHIEDESSERALLQEMTRIVAAHSERLTVMERMQVALWSVVGTVSTGGVVWVIGHLSTTVGR